MSQSLVYESGFDQLVETYQFSQEPDFLQNLRERALAIFRDQGIPTPRNEEWKYTPLRTIAGQPWRKGEPGPAVFEQEPTRLANSPIRIVLVNGRFDRNLSEVSSVPGLTAMSLRDAIYERTEIAGLLGSMAAMEQHPFAAMNTLAFEDGLYLSLREGTVIEPNIEIVHVTCGAGMVIAPRILIHAQPGAVASIVEQYVSDSGSRNLTIPVTETIVESGANIEHVRVQDESVDSFHIALWESRQANGSEYRAYNVAFGGSVARLDQNIALNGEHITTRLDGVVVARGEQLIDNHTKLDHAMPNCNSFEIYKQVVDDKATVVFNGKIYVHQDAQKTDAKQTNQALLLSPQATINSKPQLEIFADDVKCTHGATVGQIDETFRFYMRSRGIPREQAEAILVYAFAAEVLELVADAAVRQRLESRLYEKLGATDSSL